ncbi:MAG: endolytic transglycosylase MltG [Deltaproteobacteria bacterium]|nr:endolytic transglycosylase MltG [Deltaproteobacteria bacterium]
MEGPNEPIKLESDLGRALARLVSLATLLAVLGLLGALAWLFVIYPDSDGPAGDEEEVVVEVAEGTTLRRLANELEDRGVLEDARVWSVYMRMRGLDRHLRQGKIRFRVPMTPEQVARYATTRLGRIQIRILIPEGFSRFEIAARLEEYGICSADEFLDATEDSSLLASYGVEANDAEGYLFPDTYEFDDQSKPRRVVERMLANWTRRFEEIQQQYAEQLAALDGWTTHDIITLASVVEKEAAVPAERARIAGVFWNRLKSKRFLPRRRLQADPTVQYGCIAVPEAAPSCRGYDGRITRAMLDDPENPYNTYRHSGLPPGPISNPGKAAITAVIEPEKHDYFYFVARGSGRHHFSKTLRQHNIAVRRNDSP